MSIEAKKALRKSTKSRLSGLSEDEVSAQSREAQHLVLGLREYRDATNISVYLSMPKAEAQTDLLVHEALKAGKKVFVPYIHRPKLHEDGAKRRSIIEMLRLGSIEEYEGLERDSWGIPSLSPDGLEARENAMGGNGLGSANVGDEHGLELIVVPGVAFDSGMNRLGHGAGFYDEYLKRYCAGRHRKKPYLGKLNMLIIAFSPVEQS